jgi:hypothetical protein
MRETLVPHARALVQEIEHARPLDDIRLEQRGRHETVGNRRAQVLARGVE